MKASARQDVLQIEEEATGITNALARQDVLQIEEEATGISEAAAKGPFKLLPV